MAGAPDCDFNKHREALLEAASILPPVYAEGVCLRKCKNRDIKCVDCWNFRLYEAIDGLQEQK